MSLLLLFRGPLSAFVPQVIRVVAERVRTSWIQVAEGQLATLDGAKMSASAAVGELLGTASALTSAVRSSRIVGESVTPIR